VLEVVVQAQVVVLVVEALGAKPLANDIVRQTRVQHELPAGDARSLTGELTGNNCKQNEITRARS
tara:strand:+ start:98 stop:292 length:195 start_codon:yes stop_codon:yes gene_type:complete